MKRIILSVLCFCSLMTATAQNSEEKMSLKGTTWQQCRGVNQSNGQYALELLPIVKVLSADGGFLNMIFRTQGNGSIVATRGTYRLTTDSTYTESIVASSSDPGLQKKDNHLRFKIGPEGKIMMLFYTLPGSTKEVQEIWLRVLPGEASDPIGGTPPLA